MKNFGKLPFCGFIKTSKTFLRIQQHITWKVLHYDVHDGKHKHYNL